jgi:hypothetical protein
LINHPTPPGTRCEMQCACQSERGASLNFAGWFVLGRIAEPFLLNPSCYV